MVNVLILFTIVVLNPYKWVNYDKLNTYIITKKTKTITVTIGNKCLERDGCYSNDDGRAPKREQIVYVPIPMQGVFSFDDLFNQ